MKNFNLFTICVALLFFSSCTDDFSDTLIGTWKLKSIEVLPSCTQPFENFVVENGCYEVAGSRLCPRYVFSEDGIAQGFINHNNEDIEYNFTYTVDEDTEMINICEDGDCKDVSVTGDELMDIIDSGGCEILYLYVKE